MNDNFRRQRLFIWIVDAGEMLYLTRQRFFVEPLDVPFRQYVDRAFREYLDEAPNLLPELIAKLAVRRYSRGNGYAFVARQQVANKPDASNIDIPIFF